MQTKLKPIFLLAALTAMSVMLYSLNDVKAQGSTLGIFDVSAFSPNAISIGTKLGHTAAEPGIDTLMQPIPEGNSNR